MVREAGGIGRVRRLRRAFMVVTLAASAAVVASAPATSGAATATNATTNAYTAIGPCRLVDQRTGLGVDRLDDAHIITDLGASACGVPDDATAILTTITVVRPTAPGFVTASATGTPRPEVAQVNHSPGEVRANGALVPVGDDGTVTFFKRDGTASGSLVVDVVGAFVPSGPTSAGRFVALDTASRLLDTRDGGATPPPDGSILRVPLPDGVPDDATALAITAVVGRSSGPGFLTMHPAGSPRPTASTLNVDSAGQTRSGATVVPVTGDGFDVYVHRSAHVVIDTTGWFTGPSAPASGDGLFVAATPRRLVDTRPWPVPINPGGTIEIDVPDPDGATASAALTSITMIRPDRANFVTAHPARVDRGEVSTGNAVAGELVNQMAITATSPHGLDLYSKGRVDTTVDLFGWFTGTPVTPQRSTPTGNPTARQRVLTIGDSAHAGIERNGAFVALRGAAYEVRGESCRRLVRPSCDLRGNGPPPTALETLQSTPYGSVDVLVLHVGHNDQMPAYSQHAGDVYRAAKAVGIRRIVWLTQSPELRSDLGGASAFQVYERHNSVLRFIAAVNPDVHLVDWAHLVRQRPQYAYPDGIHLRPLGGFAVADTISRAVAHATGQPCPMPETPGAAPLAPCPNPSGRPLVDPAALYDLTTRIVPCAIEGPRRETICRWNVG